MGCASQKAGKARVGSKVTSDQLGTKVVLHYFDLYGRAEVIRMMLKAHSIAFEDHRFGSEEWVRLKLRAEFQVCPILEIDGKTLCETRAILRYLCMQKHMYPSDLKEIYLCESLCDFVDDIRLPLIDAARTSDIDKMMKAHANLPQRLLMLESRLRGNRREQQAFFHGKSAGMADFLVFNFLWDNFLCSERKEDHASTVPKSLIDFAERMLANSALRSYLETRSPRPY